MITTFGRATDCIHYPSRCRAHDITYATDLPRWLAIGSTRASDALTGMTAADAPRPAMTRRRNRPMLGWPTKREIGRLRDAAASLGSRYIKRAYNTAVRAAKRDDVTLHTLRHTFASWAIMRGVTRVELQELLGHASLAMTMRYAHLAPERLRTAVPRLEGLTANAKTASGSTHGSTQERSNDEELVG